MRVSNSMSRWVPLFLVLPAGYALPYDPDQVPFNLNRNQTATHPLDYSGQWENHTYHPSPGNWRMPFYTIFLDRFVNGDPSNDNANGTQWEHDLTSNQFRHGGDVLGLMDSFDYLQGMGVKVSDPTLLRASASQILTSTTGSILCWYAPYQCTLGRRRLFAPGSHPS
jgi:alpha-1,3-glucan synthase